jgi:enediyne biosynthesis protein E4
MTHLNARTKRKLFLARLPACLTLCLVLLPVSIIGCKSKSAQPPHEASTDSSKASSPAPPSASISASARPSGPITFTDVTAQAGIHFKHNSGAFGQKYLPETMGSGVCVIDYDNDGW